ncbi:hypothetical protein [Pararhizobium sp.]|uniref:hypothetical protein n=1 Tax=Pararhizobium sp. TaxID=1977563 RepID=UPI00271FE405|nr:hypothetical protein [Pararhizobium sp.]MDO9415894.1 hypothetical protein [Pararhizobium sp.]
MHPTSVAPGSDTAVSIENIAFVHQMLGELRHVAEGEGAEMLRYLIEMAFVEAGDLITANRSGGEAG